MIPKKTFCLRNTFKNNVEVNCIFQATHKTYQINRNLLALQGLDRRVLNEFSLLLPGQRAAGG